MANQEAPVVYTRVEELERISERLELAVNASKRSLSKFSPDFLTVKETDSRVLKNPESFMEFVDNHIEKMLENLAEMESLTAKLRRYFGE